MHRQQEHEAVAVPHREETDVGARRQPASSRQDELRLVEGVRLDGDGHELVPSSEEAGVDVAHRENVGPHGRHCTRRALAR